MKAAEARHHPLPGVNDEEEQCSIRPAWHELQRLRLTGIAAREDERLHHIQEVRPDLRRHPVRVASDGP